ncbi:MAG TPA: hypothetical protein VHI50_08275, partial [Micromonosporaceae bacterium]|nr:hypothetical protein [Micromonosporaceae bacterium]
VSRARVSAIIARRRYRHRTQLGSFGVCWGANVRRCPGLEEGRAVALPLEKLGTTHPPRTTPIDPDRSRVPWS